MLNKYKTGLGEITDPWKSERVCISWSFSSTKLSTGINLFKCSIEGFGLRQQGYGEGLTGRTGLKKSFFEAWERLWFERVSQTHRALQSTSGFATGRDENDAINRSHHELIERACILTAWRNQSGWRPYFFKGFRAKYFQKILENAGWITKCYSVSNNLGINVLAVFAHHHDFGSIFDAKAGVTSKIEIPLILSIIRSKKINENGGFSPLSTLPNMGSPRDHEAFYRNPSNLRAFSFLDNCESTEIALNRVGVRSEILFKGQGLFPAVARTSNENWPNLSWGKQSISGKNKWPHPLA